MIKPRAFVAEDEPFILQITCAKLEDLGFSVTTATNGKEARRALCDPCDPCDYDVIVLDNHLGIGSSGIDILLGFRHLGRTTPVVIHSGGPAIYLGRVARENGAVFLEKPSSLSDLATAIEAAGCAQVITVSPVTPEEPSQAW